MAVVAEAVEISIKSKYMQSMPRLPPRAVPENTSGHCMFDARAKSPEQSWSKGKSNSQSTTIVAGCTLSKVASRRSVGRSGVTVVGSFSVNFFCKKNSNLLKRGEPAADNSPNVTCWCRDQPCLPPLLLSKQCGCSTRESPNQFSLDHGLPRRPQNRLCEG